MTHIDVEQLRYPVLKLSRDTSVSPARNTQEMTRCTAHAFFHNRYFEDMLVIDSEARHFRVVSAETIPALSGIRRWIARFLNKILIAKLALKLEREPSLDEAKRQVGLWMDRSPDSWEASEDLDEWKRCVTSAKTARDLIKIFA